MFLPKLSKVEIFNDKVGQISQVGTYNMQNLPSNLGLPSKNTVYIQTNNTVGPVKEEHSQQKQINTQT